MSNRPRPRLRGAVHLRVAPWLSFGLNLSDVIDLAKDGANSVKNAIANTAVAERIRKKANEKRRVRIADDIVEAEWEALPEGENVDKVIEETDSALRALGFKKEQRAEALGQVREQAAGKDAKQLIKEALRAMKG